MTENKRLIVDDDYAWVDTVTECVIEVEDAFDLVNELWEENGQLKKEIEKLSYANEDLLEEKRIWKQMSDEYTKLSYENEQLNLLSNLRGEMVGFATSLIQDMGSKEMLKMWNDFREVMYQKWKKGD